MAGSVDSQEKTEKLAEDKNYPFAFGMTKTDAETLDAWWQSEREFIQPTEFILDAEGKVLFSSYSDGPVGRMDAKETLSLIKYMNEQKNK